MIQREEGSLIPEGISYTETEKAVYITRKIGDHYDKIRIPKDNDMVISYQEQFRATVRPTEMWFGTWGTNG